MVELARSPHAETSQKTQIRVVAAVPCYNTARTIAAVVAGARGYVDDVIVVDDGSADDTARVAASAGAVVISHKKNLGKGAAMRTAAAGTDADILVFIDGDGQHDPRDIPLLLHPLTLGLADYVIGSRYLSKSEVSANPFSRRVANAAASLVISFIISVFQPLARFFSRRPLPRNSPVFAAAGRFPGGGVYTLRSPYYRILNGKFKWVTDCTSGFTALRKANWPHLHLISQGFQIETEMVFEQAKNGFMIAEVPISCKWGSSVSHLSILRDGFRTLLLLSRKMFGCLRFRPQVKNTPVGTKHI